MGSYFAMPCSCGCCAALAPSVLPLVKIVDRDGDFLMLKYPSGHVHRTFVVKADRMFGDATDVLSRLHGKQRGDSWVKAQRKLQKAYDGARPKKHGRVKGLNGGAGFRASHITRRVTTNTR